MRFSLPLGFDEVQPAIRVLMRFSLPLGSGRTTALALLRGEPDVTGDPWLPPHKPCRITMATQTHPTPHALS